MSQQQWNNYFMKMAELVASKSKDPSTKCGCVLVDKENTILSTGFNGLPRNCKDDKPERNERPAKYMYYEHSERNAIYNAARVGVSTLDAIAYVTGPPCCDCARGLIQAGIAYIYYPKEEEQGDFRARWSESIDAANEMLEEAKVQVWTI